MSKLVLWVAVSILVWDFLNAAPGQSVAVRAFTEFYRRMEEQIQISPGAAMKSLGPETGRHLSSIGSAGQGGAGASASGYRDGPARTQTRQAMASETDPATDQTGRPARETQDSPQLSNPDLARAPKSMRDTIQTASLATGISIFYLVRTAERESAFNTKAKARRSSAAGLYQFIDQTWLEMVKRHGAKYDLGKEARQVRYSSKSGYYIADKQDLKRILDLRFEIEPSIYLAAELARDNRKRLMDSINRPVTDHELYLAHFFGYKGALRLLGALSGNPAASAAALFPREAKANRAIFYNWSGQERTVAQLYDILALPEDKVDPSLLSMAKAALQAIGNLWTAQKQDDTGFAEPPRTTLAAR